MAPWTGGELKDAKAKMVWKESGDEVEEMPGIPEEAAWRREGSRTTRCLLCMLARNHSGWKLALPSEGGIHPPTPFQRAGCWCLPGPLETLLRTAWPQG